MGERVLLVSQPLKLGADSLVVVDDGVDPVRNRDDSTAAELSLDRFLDQRVGLNVNCGCCLVQNQDLAVP